MERVPAPMRRPGSPLIASTTFRGPRRGPARRRPRTQRPRTQRAIRRVRLGVL